MHWNSYLTMAAQASFEKVVAEAGYLVSFLWLLGGEGLFLRYKQLQWYLTLASVGLFEWVVLAIFLQSFRFFELISEVTGAAYLCSKWKTTELKTDLFNSRALTTYFFRVYYSWLMTPWGSSSLLRTSTGWKFVLTKVLLPVRLIERVELLKVLFVLALRLNLCASVIIDES